jgi:sugar phosphate permease
MTAMAGDLGSAVSVAITAEPIDARRCRFVVDRPVYPGRWAFFGAGLLSLAWIPVWLITSRVIPPAVEPASGGTKHSFGLLADPKLWAMIVANFLSMTIYSLWTNWSPTYLVRVHHLTPSEASHYTPVVPICGYFGALLGGSLSWRFISGGMTPVAARKRACLISACFLMATVAVPLLPNPLLATAGMPFSFFWICPWSANHYTLPIDLYGASRAAFGVSALIFAYGFMQFVVSRPLGAAIEKYGFQPVCWTFAFLPIVSYFLVNFIIRDDHGAA